jgi:hypothetical protein
MPARAGIADCGGKIALAGQLLQLLVEPGRQFIMNARQQCIGAGSAWQGYHRAMNEFVRLDPGKVQWRPTMAIGKVIITAAVLAIAVPATAALAHDDDDYYSRHERDHWEHGKFHQKAEDAHARAHEEGFWSRREHWAYHRYLKEKHDGFHYYHPGTRHDHYGWYRWW